MTNPGSTNCTCRRLLLLRLDERFVNFTDRLILSLPPKRRPVENAQSDAW
jgi:hypothetical protein